MSVEDVDLSKTQQVFCLYGPRKSKSRLKSEVPKQQYTVTHFTAIIWQT